jgi:hypothetical protein
VQGRRAVAFRDFYFGVKLHKDGTFAGWSHIPCKGKCFVIGQLGHGVSIVTKK